jgi:hypothetical protein
VERPHIDEARYEALGEMRGYVSGDWEALTPTAKFHSPLHTISRLDPPSRLRHNRRVVLIQGVECRFASCIRQ